MIRKTPRPLLLHVFATFAVGGPQVRFSALANRYPDRWRHMIVAMDGDTSCRERLSADLDVSFPEIAVRKGDTFGNIRRFRKILAELHPQLLVTSNWGSIEWAMANIVPLVRHVHIEDGFGPEERDRQIPRRVWMRRLFLRRSQVVLPSNTLRQIAAQRWQLDPTRLLNIPNGIDLSRFSVHRSPSVASQARPLIGTVAALRPEKNLARLLYAVRKVADTMAVRLEVVGDGPERQALEDLTRQLRLDGCVRFVGHTPAPNLAYAGFDLFALSSDTEQMPLSVLEAMAAALPVAATNVGDIRGMVAEPNARFVNGCDEAALAQSLLALLASAELRQSLGSANRAKAESAFDQERMFEAYARLFDDSASMSPPSHA